VGTPHTHLDVPRPIFLAGSERALRRLRHCLAEVKLFVSHLPIEGERCVELIQRARRPVLWLSPWAVGHAQLILGHVGEARFVVVHGEGERFAGPPPSDCCVHVFESELASAPRWVVGRLLQFFGVNGPTG
jgi:hypothetical protein